jgi:hypothetical protein
MDFKRHVTCRYCCKEGHNRRTCPTLKKNAQENPNSYAAREVARNALKGKNRVCNYCKTEGHNRQTCESLKNDRFGAIVKSQEFRKEVWNKFQEHGIGLGTLFSVNDEYRRFNYAWSGEAGEQMFVIEQINWDNIIYRNEGYSIITNHVGLSNNEKFCTNSLFFDAITKGSIKIEVKAEPHNIGVGKPVDWEKGISNIKQAFSDWD